MSTILLSFEANTFLKLENGFKKFEYRKHFPIGPTKVYFYVSKPIKAISGIGYFGKREDLITWLEKYGDRSSAVKDRINDYLQDNNYATPLLRFQKTNRIPLSKLREDNNGFVVPRMYYYLDDTPLLQYLEQNLHYEGPEFSHSFERINDHDIC